ncbi:MAG: Flp pilus assembly complex ATPase component TadA [Lachnospiraceae bacterium]|nr:Flp pilus assembly complex ATPase component TadA [Lachnospiraceae bacterium]
MKMMRKKIKLGDLLVSAGAITEDELMEALSKQKELGMKLGQTLVQLDYISQDILNATLQQQLGIEFISLAGVKIEDQVLGLVPENLIEKYRAIPIEFDEMNPNVLRVAMSDPMDIIAIDDLSIATNYQIEPLLCNDEDVTMIIGKYFGDREAMEAAEQYRSELQAEGLTIAEEAEVNEDVENSPIVKLVKGILENAVRQRTSDIHIEPMETQVRVRYRIDGALQVVQRLDIGMMPGISARLKIMGGMDIAEKRKPQDGRITIMVDRKEFDVRVSVLPTCYGEKIVMRMTSKEGLTKPKSELGFTPDEMAKFDGILSNPHGIILVTGPTGSGKSTTLYTALSELNTEDVNIITVEDPVEANIDGINQVMVNVKAEMTFAAALRSILRQDPDIIMIGEIRDGETCDIAVKAAITGHLVVSTLHTNSAASTITRLIDMGQEPYTVADALVGVIAQRLVRRLCTCKVARLAEDYECDILGIPGEECTIYEPSGNEACGVCGGAGYRGRIGVYEILPITHEISNIIAGNGTADQIEKQAISEGMKTLRMAAAELVISGVTSIAEMKKIAYEAEDSM